MSRVEIVLTNRDIISVHKCVDCKAVPTVKLDEFPKIRLFCSGCGKTTSPQTVEQAEGDWNRIA